MPVIVASPVIVVVPVTYNPAFANNFSLLTFTDLLNVANSATVKLSLSTAFPSTVRILFIVALSSTTILPLTERSSVTIEV